MFRQTSLPLSINAIWMENVWINTGKALQQATQGEFAFEQAPQWIWHDSIAYLFPQGNNIKLKMDRQKGNWAKINFNYPATEISMPIFNLVINHGQSPETHLTHISLYRESTIRKNENILLPSSEIERNDNGNTSRQ